MKEVLAFLEGLRQHNHREWFEANRPAYETAKKTFELLIRDILREVGRQDPDVAGLSPKDCIFRINRDVRFSTDKRPYKDHFGAAFGKGGKKSSFATYYLHIAPEGQSFLAGGVWMPPAEQLARIRQEIDYSGEEFPKLLYAKPLADWFGGLDEEAKVKTTPKGYDRQHPQIEWLRYKSFTLSHPLDEAVVCSPSLVSTVCEGCQAMQPFIAFLNRALD